MSCHAEYYEARRLGDIDRAGTLEAELVEAHLDLAKRSARSAGCWAEDGQQAALESLVKRLRRFDPERGTKFEAFAWTALKGAAINSKIDEALVRVPRGAWGAGARAQAGEYIEGTVSDWSDDDLLEEAEEMGLGRVAECWRDGELLPIVRGALALAKHGGELWPRSPGARLAQLERLDAAVAQLELEHPVDGLLWRRHNIDGVPWSDLGAELGVTRQRVTKRAKRREMRLAEILASLAEYEREVIVAWATRGPWVCEAERLGLVEAGADPRDVAYMAEDLEAALEDDAIEESEARTWRLRRIEGMSVRDVASASACSERTVHRRCRRVELALRALVGPPQDEPAVAGGVGEQLSLISGDANDSTPAEEAEFPGHVEDQRVSWWSPNHRSDQVAQLLWPPTRGRHGRQQGHSRRQSGVRPPAPLHQRRRSRGYALCRHDTQVALPWGRGPPRGDRVAPGLGVRVAG